MKIWNRFEDGNTPFKLIYNPPSKFKSVTSSTFVSSFTTFFPIHSFSHLFLSSSFLSPKFLSSFFPALSSHILLSLSISDFLSYSSHFSRSSNVLKKKNHSTVHGFVMFFVFLFSIFPGEMTQVIVIEVGPNGQTKLGPTLKKAWIKV